MLYFIVTTCVFPHSHPDYEIRNAQYTRCISRLFDLINVDCKVIIVEGNGGQENRTTILNQFANKATIVYTTNNSLKLKNKGHTELLDILECINSCGILDDDFVIKLTGRYYIEDGSPMFAALTQMHTYDCIIKYGSFLSPQDKPIRDCVTGLIGMRAKYIKRIQVPTEHECIEWLWADKTIEIEPAKLGFLIGKMGLSLCPGGNEYFSI